MFLPVGAVCTISWVHEFESRYGSSEGSGTPCHTPYCTVKEVMDDLESISRDIVDADKICKSVSSQP
jgi:hypothetical protein